ncbi:MAG TPA: PIN domain-containing protein [Bacteroidetes bacterium]|nr:PIN domain-containing protein [Bacteroidota bacterium]
MKVVVDTNVLLISINPRSSYHPIFRQAIMGKYNLCISNSILLEYEEIFKFRINSDMAEAAIAAIIYSPFVLRLDPRISWRLITADPDDDKFSDCAVAADVDYLVSNDGHFKVLKNIVFPKINVISADDFLSMITSIS